MLMVALAKQDGGRAAPSMRPLMRQYELVERVKSYDPNADEALLDRAYVYAMRAHGSQKRASGDPYFNHPSGGGRHLDRAETR